jgi:lipoyl(octanoyl) transferase
MALDEALLEWSAAEGGCALRLYRWQPATLSLGYFQSYGDRAGHAASAECPAVRRLTGGGAIVHDAELTYSLVVPAGHPLAARRDRLYEAVHLGLIDALGTYGVAAKLCVGPPVSGGGKVEEPFLCFQRRAAGDVLVGDTKVAGSAQRRRRGAILQHGSILLERSLAAPELAALLDVAGQRIPPDDLAEVWLANLAQRLAVAWQPGAPSAAERCRAEILQDTRYRSPRWTLSRGRM